MAKRSLTSDTPETAVVESNLGQELLFLAPRERLDNGATVSTQSPYVSFVSNKAPAYAKVLGHVPDVQDGDPILFADQVIEPLRPFKFMVVHYQRHYSEVTDTGNILRVKFNVEAEEVKYGSPLKEHYETMLLVFRNDGSVTPARCTFKTTKCPAIKLATATLDAAVGDTEKWGKRGPDYMVTLKIPEPRFRFTTTVILSKNVGRGSGRGYVKAEGKIAATTAGEWAALQAYFADGNNVKLAAFTTGQWEDRIARLKEKVAA
jgi:hypothetical protein